METNPAEALHPDDHNYWEDHWTTCERCARRRARVLQDYIDAGYRRSNPTQEV